MVYPSFANWNVHGLMVDGHIKDCRWLIKDHKLDLICLLEMKLDLACLTSFSASRSLQFFPHEHCAHNFSILDGGRILIKWNSNKILFTPFNISNQMIHGDITFGNQFSFIFTVVYVHNSAWDRKDL